MASTLDSMNVRIPIEEMSPQSLTVSPMGERTPWGVADLVGVGDTLTREPVQVAVLDTGVDFRHPDLAESFGNARDFTESSSGTFDRQGHGTHCAGVIGARNNDAGIVGVDDKCKIYSAKVLNDSGAGSERMILNGLEWALSQGCEVVSMSLGGPSPMRDLDALITQAVNKGVAVVVAAGNSGPGRDTIGWPGRTLSAVTVGAYNETRDIASFSSRGTFLDCVAPGVNVESCYLGNRYALLSGTSMATPHIAGLISRLLSVSRSLGLKLTAVDISNLILADCKPVGNGTKSDFGFGRPNYFATLARLSGDSPPTPKPVRVTWDMAKLSPDQRRAIESIGIVAAEAFIEFFPKQASSSAPPTPPDWFGSIVDTILDMIGERLKERRPALSRIFEQLRPIIEEYLIDLIWSLIIGWLMEAGGK